jgi:hypothetical protein
MAGFPNQSWERVKSKTFRGFNRFFRFMTARQAVRQASENAIGVSRRHISLID